jgi:hypothetical protein
MNSSRGAAARITAAIIPISAARGQDLAEQRSASVNGLEMYYEIHGRREGAIHPLVLIDGGSTIESTSGRICRNWHRRAR